MFEIRYDGINQKLNLRNTYRILNIQFSVHQFPSHMMYDVIDIFRGLTKKTFYNLRTVVPSGDEVIQDSELMLIENAFLRLNSMDEWGTVHFVSL